MGIYRVDFDDESHFDMHGRGEMIGFDGVTMPVSKSSFYGGPGDWVSRCFQVDYVERLRNPKLIIRIGMTNYLETVITHLMITI